MLDLLRVNQAFGYLFLLKKIEQQKAVIASCFHHYNRAFRQLLDEFTDAAWSVFKLLGAIAFCKENAATKDFLLMSIPM